MKSAAVIRYFGQSNRDHRLNDYSLVTFMGEFRGEYLGHGLYRTVFAVKNCPELVLKVERTRQGRVSNLWEWEIWRYLRQTPHHKWLAPCVAIASDFSVMLQARTTPVGRVPFTHVPAWMTDMKVTNWGLLGDKVVCHDYSTNLLFNTLTGKQLKKARWWGTST